MTGTAQAIKHIDNERVIVTEYRFAPGANTGSHVLSYADGAGGTEAHALYGTPDELHRKLDELGRAGADYLLLTAVIGGKEQLRRFARDIMPTFAGTRARHGLGSASETAPA